MKGALPYVVMSSLVPVTAVGRSCICQGLSLLTEYPTSHRLPLIAQQRVSNSSICCLYFVPPHIWHESLSVAFTSPLSYVIHRRSFHWQTQRAAALRFIAAAATRLGADRVAPHLPTLLRPLYRISEGASTNPEEVTSCQRCELLRTHGKVEV